MNTNKELVVQALIFSAFILLGVMKMAFFDDYGISGFKVFEVVLLSFVALVAYNLIASLIWWVRKCGHSPDNQEVKKVAFGLPVFSLLLIGTILLLAKINENVIVEKNRRILTDAFIDEGNHLDDKYKVVGFRDVKNFVGKSKILNVRHGKNSSVIEYENGSSLMAVYNYRRRVVAISILSEPVAGGDATR